MRLLLDTQIWLWMLSEPELINREALEALADESTERSVSLATYWEISIKHGAGKLPLPVPLVEFLPTRLETVDASLLEIRPSHVIAVATLPQLHRDPFDRLLIAQARAEALTLVTADADMARYQVDVLWANRRSRPPRRETSP